MQASSNNNDSFLVYQASAGSGKTFNLAKEYITICLSHYKSDKYIYTKILAITFTNKAANEMKSRILSFLSSLSAENPDEELMSHFSDRFTKEEIQTRSKELLKSILHNYSDFSIYTIDSFFQRILRIFSVDLNLPSNHQLELDTQTIIKQVVDLLLSKVGHNPELTQALIQYMYSQIDLNKNWKIDKQLQQIGTQIYNEEAIPFLEKLYELSLSDFKKIIETIDSSIHSTDETIQQKAKQAVALIQNNNINFEDFYMGRNGIGKWFLKISKQGMEGFSESKNAIKAIEQDVWTSKTCEQSIKDNIAAIAPQLTCCYKEIVSFFEKNAPEYFIYKSMRNNIYPIALLNEIKHASEEIKTTNKTIHISETNFYLSQITQKEDIPFIYERLGERYKYFFIDEFQDTSILQWQNILPLVCEGLSSQTFGNTTGKTAVFGDAKQAIYRFRGGNVSQFVDLPKINQSEENLILKERENKLTETYKKIHLSKNYRSKQEVVNFNNKYFNTLKDTDNTHVSNIYKDAAQTPKENNTGGGVSLHCVDTKQISISYNEFVYQEAKKIIEEVVAAEYAYSDIAILCRANDLGSFLAQKLSEDGLNVISSDSLLLKNSEEINFMLACISYIYLSTDEVSRSIILKYIAKEKKENFGQLALLVKNNADFLNLLHDFGYDFNPNELRKSNTYEIAESLMFIFNLQEKNNPFLLSFLNIVLDYENNPKQANKTFLDYWEEKGAKASLTNPEGIDAINVMSIHKSKGLEFPIVIYPQKKETHHLKMKWIDLPKPVENLEVALLNLNKNLSHSKLNFYEEEKNLTVLDSVNIDYVAFTRAKERLYLIGETKSPACDFFENMENSEKEIFDDVIVYKTGMFLNKKDKTQTISHIFPALESRYTKLSDLDFGVTTKNKKTFFGDKAHYYFSLLKSEKDLPHVIASIQNDEQLSDSEKNIVFQATQNLVSQHGDILFGNDSAIVKTEAEIIDDNFQIYRVDRLIISNKKCILIDYKTGKPNAKHKEQILTYSGLLKKAGYANIRVYLIYIQEEGSIQVEEIQQQL